MADEKSAEAQIKAAIWQYSGWTVLLGTVFAGGIALGYILWGDAASLRAQVKDLEQRIHGVRAERENLNYEISRLTRANERLTRDLEQAKAAPTPAP